ncbi:hypothetical protein M3Y98_00176800 [Aphelenchoides besseyi]|nr:hypothetical protein M3Y98_00176800 [Aphelenchoides besseyi]
MLISCKHTDKQSLRELNQLFKQFLYHILFWFQLTFRFQQPFCQSVVELSTDPDESDFEKEKLDHEQEIIFQGTHDNNSFFVEVNVFESAVSVILMFLVDGQKYVWPNGHLEFSRNRLSERLLNFGPLRIELREPYRLWRITFRGDLRTSDGSLRFFSWESWWSPVSDPHFYTRDVPIHLAAKFAAATNNSRLLQKTEDNLQWGVLRGRLLVEGAEAKEMNLRGFRLRQTGESQTVRLENLTTAFLSTGERTSRFEFSVPNCPGLLEFGIKFGADRRKKVFVQHDDEEVENLIVHSFKFDGDSSINLEISRLLNRQGSGFTRFVENLNWNSIHSEIEQRTDYVYKADQFERKLRILPFTHRACMDSELTGGKGSNLAKLTTVEHKFVVPRGFVVTTTSFREHLNSHMELNEFYSSLKKSHGHDFEEIEKRAKELFAKFRLNDELKESIYDQLNRMYNGQQSSHRFSVRSSAFGEDGAELSSAGQLETFLYVEIDDISEKLLMCWASNFRREVLNYRFENNQQLATPMAVVIQEMIDDGKAGVVFTSDPVRSDPSRVVINLVDGDGEKLVSGQTIPMQLTVLKRDLSVVEKIGDEVLGVDSCMQIVNVGLYLESVFDHPQDIEFVWKVDEIFVVQSRHITTLDIESEWELQHEFDVATLSKHAILSTANVGEVMPVALTPLDCSIIGTAFDRAIRSIFSYMLPVKENIHRHSNSVFVIYRQRVFFDLLETLLRNWEDISKNRAPEYNLAGSKIFTDEMLELGPQHFPRKTTSQRLYEVYALTKMIFFDSKRIFANIQHLSEEMKMCTVPDDSKDILSAIQVQLDYYVQLIEQHSKATLFSNLTYVIVAMILNGTSSTRRAWQLIIILQQKR